MVLVTENNLLVLCDRKFSTVRHTSCPAVFFCFFSRFEFAFVAPVAFFLDPPSSCIFSYSLCYHYTFSKMKFASLLPLALALSNAYAFVPQQRAFRPSMVTFMADEEAPKSSALVPIKEETVEFTAGMIGGAVGTVVGGPLLGAVAAAAANYVSKMDNEASDVVSAVSKSTIEVYNYLLNLDSKYELLSKSQKSLENALSKLKDSDSVDPEAVAKVESALASTKAKISEINDEYDIVGAGTTALGVVGDLVEKTIKKVSELNEEYKLTDKATEALSTAVSKAKDVSIKS